MPEYLSPDVFIEEIPSGIRPIQAVGTSTGAFVGLAEKGPVGEAVPINNFSQFLETFGGYIDDGYLAFAVRSFFDEGGVSCYVVRTCRYTGSTPHAKASSKTFQDAEATPADTLQIDAASPGSWGDDLSIEIVNANAPNFEIVVYYKGIEAERLLNLTKDSASNDFVETRINGVSKYIVAQNLSSSSSPPAPTTAKTPLEGGSDGFPDDNIADDEFKSSDFIGDPTIGNGLHAFDKIDDINIVAVPDAINRNVHIGGMTYCEGRGDCFYIADSQSEIDKADEVVHYKLAQGDYAGGNAINSKYGALYTPWIYVFDPRTSGRIKIPPSGAIAGIYARTDARRGVHKAPAGISDGKMNTALDVDIEFVTADQDKLNPRGINVIRKMKGLGSVVWGARTVSADPEWRYLNIRRLFLQIEESIEKSTKWAVFEPNDRTLWQSIIRNISAFLKIKWLEGALVGATEEQAFYVKCDEETNPQAMRDQGILITEIGVAPSKPAEFVVFRIKQSVGGSEVSE